MAHILITGGAGFIGSHIAEKLVKRGDKVVIFDDFSTGHKENLKNIKVRIIKGDVRDLSALKKALKGVDFVSHHAAQISVPLSINNPKETLEINTKGTLNVLMAAQANGVKKVVLASSSAVYGDTKNLPVKESEPVKPLSPYAISKLLGEYYCQVFASIHGLKVTIFRYFNVYGDRQDPASPYAAAIPKFMKLAREGKPITIFGDGTQTRDFVSVSDVADVNIRAFETDTGVMPINIGCGKAITIRELAESISKKITYLPEREGDIKHSVADIERAVEILELQPKSDLINEFLAE